MAECREGDTVVCSVAGITVVCREDTVACSDQTPVAVDSILVCAKILCFSEEKNVIQRNVSSCKYVFV